MASSPMASLDWEYGYLLVPVHNITKTMLLTAEEVDLESDQLVL